MWLCLAWKFTAIRSRAWGSRRGLGGEAVKRAKSVWVSLTCLRPHYTIVMYSYWESILLGFIQICL